jgi:tetratricopeptide (TPR) repeat protein
MTIHLGPGSRRRPAHSGNGLLKAAKRAGRNGHTVTCGGAEGHAGDPLLAAEFQVVRAVALAEDRQFCESVLACEAALAVLRDPSVDPHSPGCVRIQAEAWACRGRALDGAGLHGGALASFRAAGELLRFTGRRADSPAAAGMALVMSLRAEALAHLGRSDEALACLQEAVPELRRLVGPEGVGEMAEVLALALARLGSLQVAAGRHAEALKALDEAVAVYDRLMLADGLGRLQPDLELALGQRMEALEGV